MGSHHRFQGRFCAKEEEDISVIENREGRGIEICERSIEEGIHLTIKVITNITSILCTEEEWEKEDGARLSILEQLNNQK